MIYVKVVEPVLDQYLDNKDYMDVMVYKSTNEVGSAVTCKH